MSLFVDTSAFFAAAITGDRHHPRAAKILTEAGLRLVTTDVVVTELWAVVQRRRGARTAESLLPELLEGGVEIASVGRGDLLRAMEIGEEFPDQDFSLADRTSFAVMHRLGLHRVATFDHHFAVYRFGPGRRKAFEIAR